MSLIFASSYIENGARLDILANFKFFFGGGAVGSSEKTYVDVEILTSGTPIMQ